LEEEKEKEEQATLAANAPSTLRRSPGKGKVKGGGMTKSGGWWSDEVALLEARHREQPKRAWARADVATAFKTLRLVDCDVTDCDPGLSQFVNVTKLDLSGNKVRRVGVLPPKLQGLTINSNNVSSLSGVGNGAGAPELRYLAMAYNGMPRIPRGLEARSFPLLSALDLSGNDLSDLDATILGLGELSSLTHLFLIRNPITLVAAYRKRMLFALPSLVQLDDMDVPEESQFQQPSGGEEPPPPPQVGSAVLLKATVEGVSGLPIEGSKFEELLSLPGGDGDEGGSGLVGRIQVGMLTAAAHSKELPWKASLVGKASGDGTSKRKREGYSPYSPFILLLFGDFPNHVHHH
jgi:Leucine-rich repeat (LRR) protein